MSFPPASKFQIWMDDCQRIFSVTSAKITDTAHRLRQDKEQQTQPVSLRRGLSRTAEHPTVY